MGEIVDSVLATSFTLLEYMIIWCKIQVIINSLLRQEYYGWEGGNHSAYYSQIIMSTQYYKNNVLAKTAFVGCFGFESQP